MTTPPAPTPVPRERDKNGHLKAGIRLPGWDYCKPWIYMITLTVRQRRPILGEIADGKMINLKRMTRYILRNAERRGAFADALALPRNQGLRCSYPQSLLRAQCRCRGNLRQRSRDDSLPGEQGLTNPKLKA